MNESTAVCQIDTNLELSQNHVVSKQHHRGLESHHSAELHCVEHNVQNRLENACVQVGKLLAECLDVSRHTLITAASAVSATEPIQLSD